MLPPHQQVVRIRYHMSPPQICAVQLLIQTCQLNCTGKELQHSMMELMRHNDDFKAYTDLVRGEVRASLVPGASVYGRMGHEQFLDNLVFKHLKGMPQIMQKTYSRKSRI